ncbi:uncharacterized protein [Clytia hemisphaerica]|uniref:Uncharacterized protein n=1 Tax=Clytia hemisphaerica TaxID=252671 RepID=A0A7M5TQL7_9CNID|eukprot:TCONS_00041891-protein
MKIFVMKGPCYLVAAAICSFLQFNEALTIETSSPEKYESGKPATLLWNVTYIGDKNLHSMRLDVYLQDNGTRILVGTHAGVEKDFPDFDTEISPAPNSISVNVTIKKLKSGDFYNFTLEAVEQKKTPSVEIIGRQEKAIVVSVVSDVKNQTKTKDEGKDEEGSNSTAIILYEKNVLSVLLLCTFFCLCFCF